MTTILDALYQFGVQKPLREDDQRPLGENAYRPSGDIIRYLRKENYLAELTLNADGESFRFEEVQKLLTLRNTL